MYFIVVVLLTVVLPIGSAVAERVMGSGEPWVLLLGTWMTFWAAGVRLLIAGARQVFQPRFTAAEIFGIKSDDALPFVRELGFANLAMGTLAALTIVDERLLIGAAIVGGLFYGLAGIGHTTHGGGMSARRLTAMLTDLLVFVVLAAFVAASFYPAFAV